MKFLVFVMLFITSCSCDSLYWMLPLPVGDYQVFLDNKNKERLFKEAEKFYYKVEPTLDDCDIAPPRPMPVSTYGEFSIQFLVEYVTEETYTDYPEDGGVLISTCHLVKYITIAVEPVTGGEVQYLSLTPKDYFRVFVLPNQREGEERYENF